MRRGRIAGLALLLLPAAAFLAGCGGASSGIPEAAGNGESSPELSLSGMVMTEVLPSGVRYRLAAERASYALTAKTVSATGVVFALNEPAGEIRVTAPVATWDIGGQRAAFPDGCEAGYPGGYSASVRVGDVDLRDRVFYANGPSVYSGPGFTVDGADLVWRWREGRADLRQPKAVIVPGGLSALKRG